MQAGYDGLLRDKTRPSRIPPLGSDIAKRVVALTRTDPPAEATHWTATMMAKAVGISASSVQRIWRTHGLQPHRVHQFKLSNDPKFIDKLRDVVGLYVDPPAHAIVLSVDEKSQIQALDRTQPGLPMKKGRAGTMTHDYKRHGTTTLFAALNVLDGTVIGRTSAAPPPSGFMRFLNAIEAEVPAGKMVHVILDNYASAELGELDARSSRLAHAFTRARGRARGGGGTDRALAGDAGGIARHPRRAVADRATRRLPQQVAASLRVGRFEFKAAPPSPALAPALPSCCERTRRLRRNRWFPLQMNRNPQLASRYQSNAAALRAGGHAVSRSLAVSSGLRKRR